MRFLKLFFVFNVLFINCVFAQDSLLVSRIAELYTHDNFESIRDLGPGRNCVVNEVELLTYLTPNLNKSTIVCPDTIRSYTSGYAAVDDSGIVELGYESISQRWDTDGKCFHVFPENAKIYAATSLGLEIVNKNPWSIHRFDVPEGGKWVVKRVNTAFLVDGVGKLFSINVFNPLDITILDTLTTGNEVYDIYFEDRYLFLAMGEAGWKILDISQPDSMTEITPPQSDIHAFDFEVVGDNLWIGSVENGISCFDISDIHNVTFIENIDIPINDFSIRYNIFTVNHNQNTLDMYERTSLNNVRFIDRFGQSEVTDFFVFPSNSINYQGIVLDRLSGVRRLGLDIADSPIDYRGFTDIFASKIDGSDSLFAVATDESEIVLFNVYRENASIAATININYDVSDLDILDDHLFVISEDDGLFIYRLESTGPPSLPYQNPAFTGKGMDIDENLLCLCDDNYGLKTFSFDLSSYSVTHVGSFSEISNPSDLLLYQSFAFVVCGETGVNIVDCYEPENPQLASSNNTDGFASDITMGGGYFYVADGENGVLVYDVLDPYDPELVGYYDTAGIATGVDAWHENCGVADSDQFIVLRFAHATDYPENVTSLPSEFKIESVYPNPFNPDTQVKINIPEAGLMSLKVFNILGKEVSSLSSTRVKAGSFDYRFFGKDFASGTYILQVELEGHGIQTTKMVLMK